MVSRRHVYEARTDGSSLPVGELVSRVVAEGRDLVTVEVARGRALLASRGRTGARAAALAILGLLLAVVGLAALSAAAAIGLAALGLPLGWGVALVGGLLVAGALAAGLGVRRAARQILASPPAAAEIRGGERSEGGGAAADLESGPAQPAPTPEPAAGVAERPSP